MKKIYLRLAAILLAGMIPLTAYSQEEPQEEVLDDKFEKCINIRQIRSTSVMDDQNIIFYMNQQKAFLNTLPRRCNGLGREKRFSYNASSSRLCDIDLIRVLRGGSRGLQEGISCRLGMFQPMTKDEADAFRKAPNPEPEERPVPLPEPEDLGTDESGEPEN
jgi:hypothetical protein